MQKQVHGGDVYSKAYRIDFSANINPLGMPERVKQAAMEGIERSIHYPDVECRKLREQISYKEQVPMEWILCTNGAAELLFALTMAKKSKKALLAAPGFAEYEQALKAAGCEVSFYTCQRSQGFDIGADYPDILEKSEADIIFLCNPNNPTGLLLTEELLGKILEICKQKHIFAVLDECFLEFVGEAFQNSQKKHLKAMPELLILKAFTKMYGMPGLRLGYGMCSDTQLLERIRAVLQPWNVSLPAQLAGAAALKEEAFVKETREYVEKEREFLLTELKRLPFITYPSMANYLFFEGPENLCEVCEQEGLLIRDCSNYRGLKKGYYRIAVKTRAENEELIRVLRKYYG
ncbi:MAG: pyridoxal phosphate-dependent aminotransferase [Lachnospiraceae bacterium]